MKRTGRQLFVIRHGETEWSRTGRHTGRTDVPLTAKGELDARRLGEAMRSVELDVILTSPLVRARATCELAGFGDRMELVPDLREWNYGDYEGLTSEEIELRAPGWLVFADGCPGGERPADVGARVDGVLARVREIPGNVALFAHGHLLRVLVARWLGLPAPGATQFLLDTSTLSILGYYRDIPAVKCWNAAIGEGKTS